MSGRCVPPRHLVSCQLRLNFNRRRQRGCEMSLQLVLDREIDDVVAPRRVDRDGDLLEALRRGDSRAAELLVMRYGERAYRLATRITGNGEDAEEVVQDAFWSVVR